MAAAAAAASWGAAATAARGGGAWRATAASVRAMRRACRRERACLAPRRAEVATSRAPLQAHAKPVHVLLDDEARALLDHRLASSVCCTGEMPSSGAVAARWPRSPPRRSARARASGEAVLLLGERLARLVRPDAACTGRPAPDHAVNSRCSSSAPSPCLPLSLGDVGQGAVGGGERRLDLACEELRPVRREEGRAFHSRRRGATRRVSSASVCRKARMMEVASAESELGSSTRLDLLYGMHVRRSERRAPYQHLVRDAPSVHQSIAASYGLPCSTSGAMYSGVPQMVPRRRAARRVVGAVLRQPLRHAEVGELQVPVHTHHDVLRLEVSEDDVERVHVLEREDELGGVDADGGLGRAPWIRSV